MNYFLMRFIFIRNIGPNYLKVTIVIDEKLIFTQFIFLISKYSNSVVLKK